MVLRNRIPKTLRISETRTVALNIPENRNVIFI